MCGLQDLGGHIMKIPIILFQVLLCMRLEGTPASARHISLPLLFLPIFLLQGAGVLFATLRFVEKIVLLLRSGAAVGRYHVFSSRVRDCFAFMHHGSRLLGWWSIDESSREEQARLFHDGFPGYNTFCGYPPEIVKKMPKKDLAEEVWRLQAALGEQAEITKLSQQEYERLQNVNFLISLRLSQLCDAGDIRSFIYSQYIGKKFYVGFVLKERSAQCCSLAGIASFAVPAVRDATNALSAVSVLRSACLILATHKGTTVKSPKETRPSSLNNNREQPEYLVHM
ncbi:hypothetical protein HAX54_005666 [Datura stramonium]|uniref:Uncharacterized protein n=1 Tax=Datura stramonium TaxID=4076 RepID=A0ABS8WTJ0_DATST|nr:hypothetical protein [Datura stramonium]